MEVQLDDILNRIFYRNYSEAKEIIEELNRILLEKNLRDSQIAYFSSRIFNSPQNLFNFVSQNSEDKDRDCVNLRKYIFETIAAYIKARKDKLSDYLAIINENCVKLFKKDTSNTVKEASLQPVTKILKYYENNQIKDLFDCDQLSNLFLDEIKLFKPTAGMRARMWYVLALLTKQYPTKMDQYQVEIQDVMFKHLNEQTTSSKPEQNAIAGMLKAFRICLTNSHLTGKQVNQLYLIMKVLMIPIETVKRYSVPINALRLFEAHHKLFKQNILRDMEELYESFMKVVVHSNTDVRESASEAFEAFIREFKVGIFSKAMKVFLGETQLKKFFSRLIDLSEQKVIKIFRAAMQEEKQQQQQQTQESTDKPDTFSFTGSTFKQILYKQRLLYSFLNSFGLLISNVKDISERESNHLYELALMGLQYNLKFFASYKEFLYDGIAGLIMALSYHQNIFLFWLKKLISQGMLETLKIPDNVYYAGEDYHLSLRSTCQLWLGLLDRPKIWSETCCKIFFDEIVSHINDLINNLDLGYTIEQPKEDESSNQTELTYINTMQYIPNNMNDSQYMYRIALFADEFFWKSKKNWLIHWIPFLLRSIVYRLRIYPRCIALLKMFSTLNEIMEDTDFFASQVGNDKDVQELCKIYYKELFEKYKEYQDELLNDALKVLLSIPSFFIINDTELIAKNLTLAIKRALQVGLLNVWLAYSAIMALTRLVQKLPKKKSMTFLTFITPLLSDFMIYEKKNPDAIDLNAVKFTLKMREVSIDSKKVSEKVVELLGSTGGLTHLIIPSEFRDQALDKNLAKEFLENKSLMDFKKVNLISWDHENVFTFPLPLFSQKVDIDLIKVIPKVVEIASTSTDRKMKTTACELLHSFIIYMIGKSAQQANASGRAGTKSKTNFSNLYARIFPVIFTIAADPEDISTKIFNTLCLQIVRWFSSSKDYENKETACLLDTLMNCVSVKDNSNLRDFAAVCIGEFVKWCIKQTTPEQLRENYGNIKSVIRRIENNSNYPDIYYRYGAVLALKNVIKPLREEKFLVEKYILEIAQVILNIIKMSSHAQNLTDEMKQNMNYVIDKVKEVIIKRWDLIEAADPKRGGFENIYAFIEWLYTQLLAYETDYREKVLAMWEGCLDDIVKHKRKNIESHKSWIVKHAGPKSLFKECKTLEFDASAFVGNDVHEKVELVRKNNKLLDAQLHIYGLFLNKGYFTFDEAKKYQDLPIFVKNVQIFLASFVKNNDRILTQQQRILERDPQLYKSRLSTLLHLFTFLTQSHYLQQFIQVFLNNTFNKKNLFYKIFQTLISPFEGVEINPTYNVKADRYRINTCSNLLKKLKESEKELQEETKFFEEYYIKEFLVNNPKFDLTSQQSFLKDLFAYTEFQIKSFFQGYEGLYQDFLGFLTNPAMQKGPVGVYLKKVCEALLKFIEDNLQRTDINQEEKIVVVLKFALKFNPETGFLLNLINDDNPIFQKFQVEILDSLARKWQYDQDLSAKLLNRALNDGLTNRLLIPLTQRVIRSAPTFLTKIGADIVKLNLIGPQDEIINNFTKFFYVLLSKIPKQKFLQNRPAFKKFLQNFIVHYLNPKNASLKTILEVINLLGLYISELEDEYMTHHKEIMEALMPFQSKYFPISTKDMVENSTDDVNFKMAINAVINMVIVTNRIEVLEVLYPVIREKECVPKYEKKIKDFCSKFVKSLASKPTEEHVANFTHMFNIFLDKFIDDRPENNLRWTIMYRVAFPFLEELPLNSLEEVMTKHAVTLENIITKDSFKEVLAIFEKTVEVMQEKAVACGCIEIMYRRLPGEILKNKISKRVYGEASTKELHKNLIMPLYNGKRKPLDQREFLLNHDMNKNKKVEIEPIMRHYHSSCYAALCAIISSTQTKEGPFNTFLFQVARDKQDQLWELLLEKKEDFAFEVQTNFNVVQVEKTEEKMKKSLASVHLNQLIASKYLSESFFSQQNDHHGFLVMEFDPTQDKKKDSKKKSSSGNGSGSEDDADMEVEEERKINPLDIDFEQPQRQEDRKRPPPIEVDKVNSHPCMLNLLRVIDNLHQNFPGGAGAMPGWMTALHTEALRPEAALYIKIFIIKIVINREEVFRQYAKQWSEVLFDYLMQKNNGGKGFHYFLRDVCTTLLTWHAQGFTLDESLENKKICSEVMTNLMKVAADKQSLIFRSNLKIIAGLMDAWKKNILLDKDILLKMLNFDETKEGSHLWRMTTLQVIDLALNFKIPIGAKGSYQNVDLIAQWDDNMLAAIMKNMRFSSKHHVPFLASAVCGKVLSYMAGLAGQGSALFNAANTNPQNPVADKRLKEIERLIVKFLMGMGEKEDDKFAYFLENITLSYQHVIVGEIFYKCQSKIHNLTKKPRGAIFNAIRIFIEKAPHLLAIQNEIRDICLCLRGSFDHIVRDYNEGNLLNFFRLLYQIIQLNSEHSRELIKDKIEPLAKSFLEASNENIVDIFFSIVTYIYDQNDDELKNLTKSFLLKGLNHSLSSIRSKIFDFLNHENRISLDPSARMLVSLNDLYAPESENLWLRSTVPLMVSIAKKSSDYARKLFDGPLEATAQFKDYDPSQSSQAFKFVNRSQPLTPIFTLSQQRFEDVLESTFNTENKSGDTQATQSRGPFQGVRATQQNQMFSQTLISSVIEDETQNPYGISYTQNAQDGGARRPAPRNGAAAAGGDGNANAGNEQPNIMATLSQTNIASVSRRGYVDNALMAFMATNDLKFQNVSSIGSNKVRYAPEGQQTSQLAEVRAKQRSLFINRQTEIRKKQIAASRKYRIGELPDIEIAYKDVIDPLVLLAQEDAEISSELFISIVCDLYKNEKTKDIANQYLASLKKILTSSEQFNYGVISTIHRTYLELIKRDSGVQIDADAIAKSGLRSYSYHTTVLLLEEILIAGNEAADLEKIKKTKKTTQTTKPRQTRDTVANMNQVEFKEEMAQVWLHLMEIYSALNEDDGVRGLLTLVINEENVRQALDSKLDQKYNHSIDLFNEILEDYKNDPNLAVGLNKKISEYIAEEKRESLASLGKWDIILKETDYSSTDNTNIPINTLKEKDAFYLVKALINNDEYWPVMNDYVATWRANDKTRTFVDTRFAWEMGLLSITQKDYDRAKYFVTLEKNNFLKKWEKLDLFSEAAKHDQLQHLQKVTEFEEFLNYVENTRHTTNDRIKEELISMTQKWIKRPPSTTYDSVHTWNDILFAREMFCNLISYKDFTGNEAFVESIVADLYVESAKGLLKKGVLENADSLLNKAIRLKNKDVNRRQMEYKAISSVIKLKLKILDTDDQRFTENVSAYLPKYNQIVTVLESQQKRYEGRMDEYNLNKLLMLKIFAKQKALAFLYETHFLTKDQGGDPQELVGEMAVNAKFINDTFTTIFTSNYFTLTALNQGAESTAYRGKIYHRYATFAEGLLRIYEESHDARQNTSNPMVVTFTRTTIEFLPKNLAKSFMNYICDAFNLGYYKLQQLPKLFDILLKYPELAASFKEKSRTIPAWLFLKWLPQMMFLLHAKDLSSEVDGIFLKIAETYPQAILYQFNVTYDRLFKLENSSTKTELIDKLQQKLEKFQNHYAFIQSLNQLTNPEHKLVHYYFDKIKEPLVDPSMNKEERLKLVAKELWSDVFALKKPFVNDQIGSYSAKFTKLWEKEFSKAFGNQLERLLGLDWPKFNADKPIQEFIKKLKENAGKIPSGYEKLSAFSTWLSSYDSNNYLYEAKIEIPGQYSGNTEPFLPSHVTISNFGQNVLILSSLRRPKRLTMHGSNEKSYNFLIKGIEDLRLDQRIEQLFSLMNEIFLMDAECQKRDLQINTFQVIPMTKMLGILEWVDNTAPIKEILGKELKTSYDLGVDENAARESRIKWLASIPEGKGKGIAEQHAALLALDEKTVVENFNAHQGFIPGFTLKKSLERLCSSPGAFLYIKNKFIRNYATLSVGSYILGVGDRHLENFLISTTTGEVVPIDFGYSFGQGLTLPIPELMPFRLTRVFECLMQPMGVDGIFRNTMIKCMTALRESRNVILDCCEIFVKDPLMDWIKTAKNKKLGLSGSSAGFTGSINRSIDGNSLSSLGIDEEIAWYPMKKVDIVRKKLVGAKPGDIMLIELQDSRFFKPHPQNLFKKQKEQIIQIVQGTKGTYRATLKKSYLTAAEQVDALIDQARDPNVLGRTWIGWSPYI